jgi:hypothetical protein
MAVNNSIDLMREIEKQYPDLYNRKHLIIVCLLTTYIEFILAHLPASVCCLRQNDDDYDEKLKKTFMRTCPKYFQVNKVRMYKDINSCQCRVTYSLKNNDDLPEEPDLKHLVSLLLKHSPINTVILKEQRLLELPKNIIVPYEIYCKCPKKFFDVAANRPQMQLLTEKFQILQVIISNHRYAWLII